MAGKIASSLASRLASIDVDVDSDTENPRDRASHPNHQNIKAVSGIRSQACAFPLNPSTRTSKTPICFTITNTYIRKIVITERRKNRNLFFRITASKVFVLQNPSLTPCATRLRNTSLRHRSPDVT